MRFQVLTVTSDALSVPWQLFNVRFWTCQLLFVFFPAHTFSVILYHSVLRKIITGNRRKNSIISFCYQFSVNLPGTQVFVFVCPVDGFGWRNLSSIVAILPIHVLRLRFCGKYQEVSAKYHQTAQCSPECLPGLQMEISHHEKFHVTKVTFLRVAMKHEILGRLLEIEITLFLSSVEDIELIIITT